MKQKLLKTMLLLCALVVGSSSAWGDDFVINTSNFTKPGSGSGYAAYDGNRDISGITITSSNVMVQSSTLQFKSNSGNLYNSSEMPGEITKITLATATNFTIYVGTTANPSTTTVTSGATISGNYKYFKIVAGGSTPKTATITVTYSAASSYTITPQSNNDSYGTVSLTGTTITASPKSGYRVAAGDDGYDVTSGTASVTNNGDNTFTVTAESDCTVRINFEAIPTHTATFSVNGDTSSETYEEGGTVTFPSAAASLGGKSFRGWTAAAISGAQVSAPADLITAATTTMGDDDITYYAVYANSATGIGNVDLTIDVDTKNFPTSYGTSNTFTEYNLEGVDFMIQQAYINAGKLQWRAYGHDSGTGTMYNSEALNKIQSVVLTYSGDTNKNFTLKVGDSENPTSGTEITPTSVGDVYTFDCSAEEKDYFVLTNGSNAGYLASITITYLGETTVYKGYCTTIPSAVSVTVTSAGFATYCDEYALDFEGVGIEAYVGTISGKKLTFTPINQVPANTGLLLVKAGGGTVDVPVINSADAVVGNCLTGVNEATTLTANDYILNVVGVNAGFYKAGTYTSLAAHRAYIPAAVGGGVKEFLSFEFEDDDATSIERVQDVQEVQGAIFNLAGQRLQKMQKGINIVNGKKILF